MTVHKSLVIYCAVWCSERMQNQNDTVKDDAELAASISAEQWGCCSVEEPSFQDDEAAKVPYVGDKVSTKSNLNG